jgi:hypothetical protein
MPDMAEPPRIDLALTNDVQQLESALAEVFLKRALEGGFAELAHDGWSSAVPNLETVGEPTLRFATEHNESVLIEREDVLYVVSRWGTHIDVQAAGRSRARLEALFTELHELLPAPDPTSKQEVTVTFWTYGPHGPDQSWRSIAVPRWDEIEANYAAGVRAELQRLMRDFQPAHGGQLILWHGLAGTGKTFALRALAWEWRAWCEFHYIVDPDSFFGAHADYLMSVLLQEGRQIGHASMHARILAHGSFVAYGGVSDDEEDEPERAWRVLVLEDTGELLTPDARSVIGQGLSRFLNVVDGLIGQGLRVLVLVTTNEPIASLHPAVARPGRCAANVEFTALSGEEAHAWLAAHAVEPDRDEPATLAALYARAEGREPVLSEFGAG